MLRHHQYKCLCATDSHLTTRPTLISFVVGFAMKSSRVSRFDRVYLLVLGGWPTIWFIGTNCVTLRYRFECECECMYRGWGWFQTQKEKRLKATDSLSLSLWQCTFQLLDARIFLETRFFWLEPFDTCKYPFYAMKINGFAKYLFPFSEELDILITEHLNKSKFRNLKIIYFI